MTFVTVMFQQRSDCHQTSQSSIVVHDGYATIRRTPYTCRARLPQTQYCLDTVIEEPSVVQFRPKPDIPWWEIATRRSKYHSCSDLQVNNICERNKKIIRKER